MRPTRVLPPVLIGLLILAAPERSRAENIVYPANAGVLDVRAAPYNAKGDGITDDTAALQKALSDALHKHRIVYLPVGTYLVSDTLRWNNGAQNRAGGWGPFLQLQGQSRAGTVIRLKNAAPGFGDPATPRAVVQTGSSAGHGDKRYSNGEGNEAFENHIRNLTVDVGAGNPGAVGIDYQVSNVGAMRHVTVRSGGGPGRAGYCGISLTRRDNGPGLIKDVSVEGFRFGVRAGQEICVMVLEDVRLLRQGEAGIWNRDAVLAVRRLRSQNAVPALKVSGVAMVHLLDAHLSGAGRGRGEASAAAIECDGPEARVYVRGLKTRHYAAAIRSRGRLDRRASVAEWLSDPPVGPAAGGVRPTGGRSLNLPVRETPEFYDPDVKHWADAGAPSGSDDTRAVQAAMDSGKATVYLRYGTYRVRDTIVVPPTVKLVLGVGSSVDAIDKLPDGKALFRLEGGTGRDVTIFDRFTVGGKGSFLVDHASPRAVVLRDLLPFDAMVYRNRPGAGPLFIEDVSGAGYRFDYPARVWARQWNFEGPGEPKVRSNGAVVWGLGFKHEGHETLVENRGGGRMELLGGLAYTFGVAPHKPAFVNHGGGDLALSLVGVSYVGGASPFFPTVVRESGMRGARTYELKRAAVSRGGGVSVLLYTNFAAGPRRVPPPPPRAR